jgi:hypothetical protein
LKDELSLAEINNGGSPPEAKPPVEIHGGNELSFNQHFSNTEEILPPFQKQKGGAGLSF